MTSFKIGRTPLWWTPSPRSKRLAICVTWDEMNCDIKGKRSSLVGHFFRKKCRLKFKLVVWYQLSIHGLAQQILLQCNNRQNWDIQKKSWFTIGLLLSTIKTENIMALLVAAFYLSPSIFGHILWKTYEFHFFQLMKSSLPMSTSKHFHHNVFEKK